MFKVLDGLGRAIVGLAVLPVDAIVDVVTLGGTLNDGELQTGKRCRQIGKALDDAVKP